MGSGKVSVLALHPVAPCSNLNVPKNFLLMLLRFIGGTATKSGQRLDNFNQIHLVLAKSPPN